MIKEIDMNTDTFMELKNSMTLHMKSLLSMMERYGTDEGSVNVKIDVELKPGKDGLMPFINYKVTSAVQIKDESKGQMGGDFILETDRFGCQQLNFLNGSQTSMFGEAVE